MKNPLTLSAEISDRERFDKARQSLENCLESNYLPGMILHWFAPPDLTIGESRKLIQHASVAGWNVRAQADRTYPWHVTAKPERLES